eukprot:TRINITY_DN93365_c0_g1_i1.p1 TRINITY_DN93365_c0_g1~~TRINITY_DN93365_c0_g1_i1.p1  ORF type:complete len:104 (+),score=20.99 TRINITY_DN93365_c0_g1_i1:402-713(+)
MAGKLARVAQLGNMKPIWLQENDIDCEKALALVARVTSIGTLVAILAIQMWPLYQIDVKNAFLYLKKIYEISSGAFSSSSKSLLASPCPLWLETSFSCLVCML